MAHVIENSAIPAAVKEKAQMVQHSLGEAVIAEQHEGKDMEHATGLTVWAPSNAVDISLMADRYEKENVPEFVQASGYLPFLKDALAKADQQALKDFMSDMKLIRNIGKILKDPDAGLTDGEKKILKQGEKSIFAHAQKLKEKLDLTIARVDTMGAGSAPPEPLLFGNEMKDYVDEQITQGTLGGGG
jgi:hypothetical protein